MSEGIPGTDTWHDEITAPSTLDPANGTEIKTGLEHLADRTYRLAQLHLYRQKSRVRVDAGYGSYQSINPSAWETVTLLTLAALTPILDRDLIIIDTVANYSITGATLLEVQHITDVDGGITARRRLPFSAGDYSFVHTSWYVASAAAEAAGSIIVGTQMKINTGSLTLEGPNLTIARLMRETSP